MFDQGFMLKLFRLARLPRLNKLMDETRFKRVLTEWDGQVPSIATIQAQQYVLGWYKVFKLILIMLFMIYGVACIFYLIVETVDQESGFLTYHGMTE